MSGSQDGGLRARVRDCALAAAVACSDFVESLPDNEQGEAAFMIASEMALSGILLWRVLGVTEEDIGSLLADHLRGAGAALARASAPASAGGAS